MVGHSMVVTSRCISPAVSRQIKKVVTLGQPARAVLTEGKFKIVVPLQRIRVQGRPGVVSDDDQCEKAGITVVQRYQNKISDHRTRWAKSSIETIVQQVLEENADNAC